MDSLMTLLPFEQCTPYLRYFWKHVASPSYENGGLRRDTDSLCITLYRVLRTDILNDNTIRKFIFLFVHKATMTNHFIEPCRCLLRLTLILTTLRDFVMNAVSLFGTGAPTCGG